MTTSIDPRGRLSELYSAAQTNLLTPAAAPGDTFIRRHFYDWTPSPQQQPQEDEIMGGGFANSIDARPAAPDIHRAGLRVAWPLDLEQIGWVLAELLGPPTTTGTEAPYTHTFDTSKVQIPTRTFERKLGAAQFDGAEGVVARSLQFPLGSDRGYVRVSADYFARRAREQYDASVAGTVTTPPLVARVPRATGTLKLDGVALAAVLAGDVTFTNVLGEDSYHGSPYVDDVQVEGRTVTVNLTGRYKGAAMRDLGKVSTGQLLPGAHELEVAWQLTADLKLVLTLRNLRFSVVGVATSGPGRLDVPLSARAEVGAAEAMASAVLVNGRASYA